MSNGQGSGGQGAAQQGGAFRFTQAAPLAGPGTLTPAGRRPAGEYHLVLG